ncbi:MAG: methyltransferase domain-containing protein [Chloroflexi bacterium]|nr:methyltransferase domain-containing protein [Chloroflexota bacterium]
MNYMTICDEKVLQRNGMPIFYVVGLVVLVLVLVSLVWRLSSQKWQIPFPAWLSWLFLDNPLIEIIIRTQATIDRIGLRSGEQGLDVGCGAGRLSIPAAKKVGPTGKIVALDIQPKMLNQLQKKIGKTGLSNIVTQLGDITSDDITSSDNLQLGSFDRVWLVTVLGEIPNQQKALQNLYRLLKPGGTLSVTEIFGDPHYQARSVVLRLGHKTGFEPSHYLGNFLSFTQNFIKPE